MIHNANIVKIFEYVLALKFEKTSIEILCTNFKYFVHILKINKYIECFQYIVFTVQITVARKNISYRFSYFVLTFSGVCLDNILNI